MEIVEQLEQFPKPSYSVVTSGTFDGVHFGHKKILRHLVNQAKEVGGKSIVLTFWPHPRFVLKPDDKSLKLLSTFEEKAELFESLGIDYLVKIRFTKEFAQLSSEQFIQEVVVGKLNTKQLIIGYDHRFGKNREGGFEYLKDNSHRFGFEVEEIARQDIDDVAVSSTKIRQALSSGQVSLATEYLERNYSIVGKVVSGNKLGTKLGFPTANIRLNEDYKLIPADGAYAVRVLIRREWIDGMLNIGLRPTIEGTHRVIEVHLFDFDQHIYDEQVLIEFVDRLREEIKFDGLDLLKNQLIKDKQKAIQLLSKY